MTLSGYPQNANAIAERRVVLAAERLADLLRTATSATAKK